MLSSITYHNYIEKIFCMPISHRGYSTVIRITTEIGANMLLYSTFFV
jgi:hypothetical protein